MAFDYKEARNLGFTRAVVDSAPEIKTIIGKAIKKNWTDARIQAELEDTKWYKRKTEAQRNYDLLKATNPREARRRVAETRSDVDTMVAMMGIKLSKAKRGEIATKATRFGWDENEIRWALASARGGRGDETLAGGARTVSNAIDELTQQYLVGVGSKQREKWITQVVGGRRTIDDLEAVLQDRAASMYSGVADDIRGGATTQEVMAPYLQDAANELGITEGSINMRDPMWTAPLTGGDGGRAMTREEWVAKIRTDKKYGWDKTIKAQNEAAELANGLAGLFGMR